MPFMCNYIRPFIEYGIKMKNSGGMYPLLIITLTILQILNNGGLQRGQVKSVKEN